MKDVGGASSGAIAMPPMPNLGDIFREDLQKQAAASYKKDLKEKTRYSYRTYCLYSL